MSSDVTIESTDGVNTNYETGEPQLFPSCRKVIDLKSI